jgi:hypothetical protein
MSKALKIILIVLAAIVVVGGALTGGWFLGGQRANAIASTVATQTAGGTTATDNDQYTRPGSDPGMMGNRDNDGYGGMMNGGNGRGHGGGMMQGYTAANVTPLTIDQATQAAQKYIDSLNLPDLKIAEVMIFDNGAYVRVIEKSTGIGAFELLVDPVTQAVYPEHGASMMWNLKYGGIAHDGMMGGWTTGTVPANVSSEMTVTSAQATQDAQKFLDANLPGTTASTTPDAFYGYYTVEVLKDGKTYGMLSVNGFSGQIIYHNWHGAFIEMSEEK